MNKEDLKIIYMGTPEFSVAPLRALVEGGYRIVAVVTMPDKPIGRGMKIQSSPVKQYALSQGLPVLQPEHLKDASFVEALRAYQADLQIVVAFRMLPEVVWAMPPMGTFNLHASLLPQYRGAAPIHWAVINGDKQTGVTTFLLKHEIDTGNILLQEKIDIAEDENTGSVHDRLMEIGSKLVVQTVDLLMSGNYEALPQASSVDGKPLRSAPKLFKENTRIDWSRKALDIYNQIRGLSPYPAAWTSLQIGEAEPIGLKIFESSYECQAQAHSYPCGSILTDGKQYIKVAVADGFVSWTRFQLAGKKPMSAPEFLRGFQHLEKISLL